MALGPHPLLGLAPPPDAYFMLSAVLDQQATQRLVSHITGGDAVGATRIHVLLHSIGGGASEGVLLYNVLRSLPVEVWGYNMGSVHSAAATAYLGGHRRIVAPTGAFMLHSCQSGFQAADARTFPGKIEGLQLEDKRTESIARAHLDLSPEQWERRNLSELWLSGEEAVACGLATELGFFKPPPGTRVTNVLPY